MTVLKQGRYGGFFVVAKARLEPEATRAREGKVSRLAPHYSRAGASAHRRLRALESCNLRSTFLGRLTHALFFLSRRHFIFPLRAFFIFLFARRPGVAALARYALCTFVFSLMRALCTR